jgi:zinc D-Ala-D-Ala carboxypeptidase
MRLTSHFTLEEMIISQTASRMGLNNFPNRDEIGALKYTANGLERIRIITKFPIVVLSGFRSLAVNAAIGGTQDPLSQHCYGEAADIICPGYGSAYDLARLIEEHALAINYDQLIYEFGQWVHVSFCITPRRQTLTIHSKQDGYRSGIVPMTAIAA